MVAQEQDVAEDCAPTSRVLIDRTAFFRRRGYEAISSLRHREGADAVETRLFGKRVLCVGGSDGVSFFYENPALQRDQVSFLTGRPVLGIATSEAPRAVAATERRDKLAALLSAESARRMADAAEAKWQQAFERWDGCGKAVIVFDEALQVFGATACEWAGVPESWFKPQVARNLARVIDGSGNIGARRARARVARKRLDRWAAGLIEAARNGDATAPAGSALDVVAGWADSEGQLLDVASASTELLDLLRPVVAVAWLFTFAVLALHRHPAWQRRVAEDRALDAFAHEVRRFYPFIPLLTARASEETEWRGHQIPPGRVVVLDVYGTLHDPEEWALPERFSPQRFLDHAEYQDSYIPNGARVGGAHGCPGELATQELLKRSIRLLTSLQYSVPRQELRYRLSRIPTRPYTGVALRGVSRPY